jgi:DNA-binding transcriptional MerR regulator
VQSGLLYRPQITERTCKSRRIALYTAEHRKRLEQIKRLRTAGHTLSDIARLLGDSASRIALPTSWWQHQIVDDVVVWVKSGISPWCAKQVRSALEELIRRVQPVEDSKGKERSTT